MGYLKAAIAGVVAIIVWQPADALACACAGPVPSSLATRHADIVFVGTVSRIDRPLPLSTSRMNADGSTTVTVGINSGGPDRVFFEVAHVYKGLQVPQLALSRGNTTCDMPFKEGEKWIVYAEDSGETRAFGCSRTRLYADGAQDVIYLENAERRRAQGLVYGEVLRRRDTASGNVLSALEEPLRVVAANASGRYVTTTDRWGPFEVVLPPGDFEIWVERSDKPVAARRVIHVDNAADLRLHLIVEYDDARHQ